VAAVWSRVSAAAPAADVEDRVIGSYHLSGRSPVDRVHRRASRFILDDADSAPD
jgi:hypothetical protein